MEASSAEARHGGAAAAEGAAGGGAAGAPGGGLSVVCWNVLAHIHTHHNWAAHGAPRKTLETPAQRDARHRRVARTLARLAPDVALLQEADESFMPVQWQPEEPLPCGERLDGYTPYRSYSDRGDGCVVLLRQQSFRCDEAVDTVYSPAADFLPPRQGVMVHARRVGAAEAEPPFAIASVHLEWGAARAHLANPIPRPFAPCLKPDCLFARGAAGAAGRHHGADTPRRPRNPRRRFQHLSAR